MTHHIGLPLGSFWRMISGKKRISEKRFRRKNSSTKGKFLSGRGFPPFSATRGPIYSARRIRVEMLTSAVKLVVRRIFPLVIQEITRENMNRGVSREIFAILQGLEHNTDGNVRGFACNLQHLNFLLIT